MDNRIHNINVVAKSILPPPEAVKKALPVSPDAERMIIESRQTLQNILDRRDPRLFAVVGPCSIHDTSAALEYAGRLKSVADSVGDVIFILMRVYFEKPRTTVGWKGLINDPDMNDSFQVEKGIHMARELLLNLTDIGLPTATEALDPIMPQYLGDLVTWTAIGARTTESQTHREMASGLSTPVGFKNGTDGSLDVAVNALESAQQPHHFLGINQDGRSAVFQTGGNRYGHVVLRGGGGRPNYDSVSVALCEKALREAELPQRIVIDCSHGNSNKDPALQPLVARDCFEQIINGNRSIYGFMLESNLREGKQPVNGDPSALEYGVSVTDSCIGWETTEQVLAQAAEFLRPVIQGRKTA